MRTSGAMFVPISVVLLAASATTPLARPEDADARARQVRILMADAVQPADRSAGRILIQGYNFLSRRETDVVVTLAGYELLIVGTPTPTEIVAELPAGYPPGTYLLTVARRNAAGRRDAEAVSRDVFDLAIGAVGPAGPKGDKGDPGPVGPQGAPGSVTSFDQLRGLPCTLGTAAGTIELTFATDTGAASIRCVVSPPPPPNGPPLDVVLLIDTTGSLGGEIANMKASFASVIFSAIRARDPNTAFAIATFKDFPVSPYGDAGDLPYHLAQPLTLDLVQAQQAIGGLTPSGGGDLQEGGTPALYAVATGAALTWPGGAVAAGPGVGFRPGSRRVVVVVTDADFHNDFRDNYAYSFSTYRFSDAVSALNAVGVKAVGAFAFPTTGVPGEGLANLDAYASATGAVVDPTAFGSTGLCGTGLGGAARPPDASGRCPLVFLCDSSGTGLSTSLVTAITLAAGI